MCHQLIQQDACPEGIGAFEGGVEAEELLVVLAALFDAGAFRAAEVVEKDEIEEIVIIGRGFGRQFAGVGGERVVFGGEARERVEEVIGGDMRGFACEPDGQAQLEKS